MVLLGLLPTDIICIRFRSCPRVGTEAVQARSAFILVHILCFHSSTFPFFTSDPIVGQYLKGTFEALSHNHKTGNAEGIALRIM